MYESKQIYKNPHSEPPQQSLYVGVEFLYIYII